MIREILPEEYAEVYSLIRKDNARNYFIRLGFESGKPVYEKIFGEKNEEGKLIAVLLKRRSGNLQLYAEGEFDVGGFTAVISKLKFDALISPRSYCDHLLDRGLFSTVKEGAFIAKLSIGDQEELEAFEEVEPLKIEDLQEVSALYQQIFTAFSSVEVMEKRLRSGRGRGVCIRRQGKIVSVAQSEFEEAASALIVGVGTAPAVQGQGLATKCLKTLCSQLILEGKALFLQYDNPDAGRIYEKLGFKPIDQVRHYKVK